MIDLRGVVDADKLVADARAHFESHPDWLGGFGLSPHAPYTASTALYRATRDLAHRWQIPWTTHLCESRDEDCMFRNACGPLHDFLATLGRPMNDCGAGRSSLEALVAAGALGPECITVHLNTLDERDFALLALGAPLHGLNVVHCPQCHRYFKHPPFPAARLLREGGINLCLGTDSLASSPSLNLFAELRVFAAGIFSTGLHLSTRQLLETVTLNPARALGLSGRLGCVRTGAWADLIALPDNHVTTTAEAAYETVLAHSKPVEWALLAGRPIP
jgi:cytosine/adenosine deaminase-related metal-dependent hydrolase